MIKSLLAFLVLAGLASAQTAVFPGAVVGDRQLMVAANNLVTTLAAPVALTDTSLLVSSTTGFQANMLITFSDSREIAVVCAVAGANLLNLGFGGSCPNAQGRGFDNTTATTHIATAGVADFYAAWHHNALKNEIEAIETALGANLANIPSSAAFPILLTGGVLSCPTCVRSPAPLALNAVVIGGGGQASSSVAVDNTVGHVLLATAGAPAFGVITNTILPGTGTITINGVPCTLGSTCTIIGGTVTTCSVSSPSTTCTHNLNTLTPLVSCYDGSNNFVAAQGSATGVNTFLVTSNAALTCRFQ